MDSNRSGLPRRSALTGMVIRTALFELAGAGDWICRPEWPQRGPSSGLAVGHRMVAAHLDEAIVQSLCEQIVIVGTGHQGPEKECFYLECSAHPANFAITKPQVALREAGPLTVLVERVRRLNGHWTRHSIRGRHPRSGVWTGVTMRPCHAA